MKLKGLFLIGLFTVSLMSFTSNSNSSTSNLEDLEDASASGCGGGEMVCATGGKGTKYSL